MDADKIKNFFLHHFEKIILILVIAASGYLMYSGFQMPDFLEQQNPDALASQATQVKSEIDLDHNEAILPERQPTFDIVKETARADAPVDPSVYSPPQTWTGKSPNSIVRRQDPELLPPACLDRQAGRHDHCDSWRQRRSGGLSTWPRWNQPIRWKRLKSRNPGNADGDGAATWP